MLFRRDNDSDFAYGNLGTFKEVFFENSKGHGWKDNG